MTFDEARRYLIANFEDMNLEAVISVLSSVREEYAPTVEMTKSQRDLIFRTKDDDQLYEIMGDGDGYYLNAGYWEDLTPNQVASAFLHPESIKVVNE